MRYTIDDKRKTIEILDECSVQEFLDLLEKLPSEVRTYKMVQMVKVVEVPRNTPTFPIPNQPFQPNYGPFNPFPDDPNFGEIICLAINQS